MAGITNLAKGAAKNIAQALSTDGVGKALAKRAAVGAGIGAVGGGTLSAIQGGSFGEGAVRGGFIGAGIGAASGAYTMGAFGSNALDEAGRFRKGATSVYSHIADGTAIWEEVNKYRQKDFNAFMGHMRDAQDADDLAARFRQMDGTSKKKYQKPTISKPSEEVIANLEKDAAAKATHDANINLATAAQGKKTGWASGNKDRKNWTGRNIKEGIQDVYNNISPSGSEKRIQDHLNTLQNLVESGDKGKMYWRNILGRGQTNAMKQYGVSSVSGLNSQQLLNGIYKDLNNPNRIKMLKRFGVYGQYRNTLNEFNNLYRL